MFHTQHKAAFPPCHELCPSPSANPMPGSQGDALQCSPAVFGASDLRDEGKVILSSPCKIGQTGLAAQGARVLCGLSFHGQHTAAVRSALKSQHSPTRPFPGWFQAVRSVIVCFKEDHRAQVYTASPDVTYENLQIIQWRWRELIYCHAVLLTQGFFQ